MNISPSGQRSPDLIPESPSNSPARQAIVEPTANSEAESPRSSQRSSTLSALPEHDVRLRAVSPAAIAEAHQRQRLRVPSRTSRLRRAALDTGLAAVHAAPLALLGQAAPLNELADASAPDLAATAAVSQPSPPPQSQTSHGTSGISGWSNPMHRRASQIAAPESRTAGSTGRGTQGFAAMIQTQGLALELPPGLAVPTWPTSRSPESQGAPPFGLHQISHRGRGQPSNRRTARMIRDLMQPSPLMLADIATQWSNVGDADNNAELHARWNSFSREGGAQVFSEFLVKLTGTINADNAAFKKQTANLLTQLVDDPALRQQVFAISVDSTTACEDRVSLAFVTMLAAARAAKFRHTTFASDADAVTMQRQFHRLDLLHALARTIVNETHNTNEELETHLHLLTRHVDALQLTGTVPDMQMRWDTCSQVSPARDAAVAPTIKRQENEHFARWLSHSPSWLDYIEREDKARFDAMHEARAALFEQQFQSRLDTRLNETGLNQRDDPAAWADAERAFGKIVAEEITDQLHAGLSIDFLTARGNAHLLEPFWPAAASDEAALTTHSN